uniref:N-acetyltransferase domain-containing protein n=1 Tax=Rhizophora mucronata TaxID=61149 RepID=A0A2P2ME68_RHIMU
MGKSRVRADLLSAATAIFRECFDPIVATSGRDLIPVMVYGRNISGQEFLNMYCVLLLVKGVVVSAGLLRIFGREVAELPLVATCREYQGRGYFQALFSCVERFLCSLNVEKLVLPAAEEAESIWTKKFGFKKMSEGQLSRYTRDYQLTIFKGASVLEKEVPQAIE